MNKLLAVWGVDLSCKCALIGFGHTRAVQRMRPEKQNKITLEPYNLQTILIRHIRSSISFVHYLLQWVRILGSDRAQPVGLIMSGSSMRGWRPYRNI